MSSIHQVDMPNGGVTSSLTHVAKIVLATHHIVVSGRHNATSSKSTCSQKAPYEQLEVVAGLGHARSATVAPILVSAIGNSAKITKNPIRVKKGFRNVEKAFPRQTL